METRGHYDEKFAAVRDAFERNFSEKRRYWSFFCRHHRGCTGHRHLGWTPGCCENPGLGGGPRGWMLQRRFYESLGLVKPRESYGA